MISNNNYFFMTSKEFFDSFDVSSGSECSKEDLMGMTFECTQGNFNKCNSCEYFIKRYPKLSDDILVKLFLLLCKNSNEKETLQNYILKNLIFYKNYYKQEVQSIFKGDVK